MGFDALAYADDFLRRSSIGPQFRTSHRADADILPVSTTGARQGREVLKARQHVQAVSPHTEETVISLHSRSSDSDSECCDNEDRSCCSCGSHHSHLCRAGLDAVEVSPIATQRRGYRVHDSQHRSAVSQSFTSGSATTTTTTQFMANPSYYVTHTAVPQSYATVPAMVSSDSRPNHLLSSPGKPELLPRPRTYVRPVTDGSPPSDGSTPSPLWRREYSDDGHSSDSSTASIWDDDYRLYGSHGHDRIAHVTSNSRRYSALRSPYSSRRFK